MRATLIDFGIALIPVVLGALLLAAGAATVAWLVVIGGLALALLQPALSSARPGDRNGQSWGKQLTGIRVVRDDRRALGLGDALLRETVVKSVLLFWVGLLFLLIPWLIDALWPLRDEQRRALHDIAAGTHVVRA